MGPMPTDLNGVDGELVAAQDMPAALTTGTFVFADDATQTFTADGRTVYVERGRPTQGEWAVVADGRFSSFWPPSYRAVYVVRWIVEDGTPVGISFTETQSGSVFEGRYQ